MDSSGVPLAGGSNDPHWTILSGPSGTFPAPAVVAGNPPGDYASNSNSRWVWENASQNAGINSPYTFRETFDLTGENPNRVPPPVRHRPRRDRERPRRQPLVRGLRLEHD